MRRRLLLAAVAVSARALLIHYHASVSERIDVAAVDREFGYCAASDCQPSVISYEAGTLMLDVVDARTNRVIWRAWAQDRLEGLIDNQDMMEEQINEAVTRMLERLPPAL